MNFDRLAAKPLTAVLAAVLNRACALQPGDRS